MVPALAMDVVAPTNKTPVSSVRGAGYPQAAFAMERLMDSLARAMGIERAEVRRRNLIPAEKMPYLKPLKARSGVSMQYDSGDYPACQADILRATAWDDFPRRQAAARAQGRYIGIGLAHGIKGTGRGPFEFGGVKISPTGRITVSTGAAAMGQGLATALAQICAEAFGVQAKDVTVVAGDTSAAPLGLGGFASRQTVTAGSSVQIASQAVAAKARKLASHMLEAAEEDLEIVDGEVRVVGAPQLAVKLGELARVLKGAPGYAFPEGIDPGLAAEATFRVDQLAYSNACHVVEVEVDIETGGVTILRYVAIQDSGRRVNPQIVEGQVHGGIAHGIGNAMFEWMGYDDAGQPVTTTFADYLLPTATEVPAFETLYKESPSPHNPLGVKGVGEVGVIPAAAAIISAIEDALSPFQRAHCADAGHAAETGRIDRARCATIRLLTCRCSGSKVAFEYGEPNEPPDCRRARPRLVDVRACRIFAGACAEFSRSAGAPDHSLWAGRHHRLCRPRVGAEDRRGLGPNRRGGEQAGGRRHCRRRLCRAFGARRLQHGRHGSWGRHQPDPAEIDAL